MDKEIWKDIEGFPSYEISNYGRVRSYKEIYRDKKGRINFRESDKYKILSLIDHSGYKVVSLREDGETKRFRVHRLVAKAFVPNPNNYPLTLHKDDKRWKNYYKNLYWGTHDMNFKDRVRNFGKENMRRSAILTEDDVIDIRNAYRLGCFSYQEIADAYDVSMSAIAKIITRINWKHI